MQLPEGVWGSVSGAAVGLSLGERQAQTANTAPDSANEIFVYLAFGTVAFREAHRDSQG